jgi:hypothetical protein
MARTCYAGSGVLYPTTSRSNRASWALILLNKGWNRSSGYSVLWDVDISGVAAEKSSLPIEAPGPRRKQRFEMPLVCSIVAVPLGRGLPSISDQ